MGSYYLSSKPHFNSFYSCKIRKDKTKSGVILVYFSLPTMKPLLNLRPNCLLTVMVMVLYTEYSIYIFKCGLHYFRVRVRSDISIYILTVKGPYKS